MKVRDVCLIPILATILFVQEQALSFIPNFQFTFLLLMVYSRTLGVKRTFLIILIHVFIDNVFMGSFVITFIPMLIGYTLIPIIIHYVKTDNVLILGLLSLGFSMFYCLLFIPFNLLYFYIDLVSYLIADIPFTILLMGSNFLAVLWLYAPLVRAIRRITDNDSMRNHTTN